MEFEQQLGKIVHRCRNGERAAFEELFEMYQPRLKYYVRRLDKGGSNIDDILQDISSAVAGGSVDHRLRVCPNLSAVS